MQGFDCSAIMGKKKLQVLVPYNDEMKVLINYIDRKQFSDLVELATVTKYVDGQLKPEFDNILFGELLGEAAIADWEGPVADDAPIACTPENKKLFMSKWMAFAKFISAICTDLERLVSLDKESVRKNLESSSGPEPISPA